jgi:4,5-dihydroxyphthalate decarboxylase
VVEALTVALGRTSRTEALFNGAALAPSLPLHLPEIKPISRAFAPMVREGRYPVSEMAIATFLMAKAAGVELVLIPCVLMARFQEGALLVPETSPIRAPEELRGARVGVRAYSQTTGMWIRGVLQSRHGLPPDAMRWVTFEDAHVASYRDPPFAERAPAGATLEGMVASGEIAAAIFGNDMPGGALRPVFDVPAATAAFRAEHGFTPVNHLLCARTEVARDRAADIARLLDLLRRAGAEVTTRAALAPALALASRFCAEQGLTPRGLSLDEIWKDTPAVFT